MSYGYTCNWCGRFGKPSEGQYNGVEMPTGWAQIKFDTHVCSVCLEKGKEAAKNNIGRRDGK